MLIAGLLVGRGKKVKFHGIFRDKFAERTADFAGIFAEKRLIKNGQFRESFPNNFRWKAIQWFCADLRDVFNETRRSYSIYSGFILQYEIVLYKYAYIQHNKNK